ncbi:DUF3492 domain-containing protein, partial [Streptomyces sp. 796.1]|uniref:DUF3492 domain-containing protein n=1 Tax=Streptomyces sp. 796.1 TaxID=3163029 RepID=UPI0039C8FD2A
MRVGLLTDGGYPYANGAAGQCCDRLVRALDQHEFEVCALTHGAAQEAAGRLPLPAHVVRVRTAPLWGPPLRTPGRARGYRRRERASFAEHFGRLARALAAAPASPAGAGASAAGRTGPAGERSDRQADRFATVGRAAPRPPRGSALRDAGYAVPAGAFADGLYGLAELAREHGGLPDALRSPGALRLLEAACRAPGATRDAQRATVADLLAVLHHLERALRPLSLDWYGAPDGAPARAGAGGRGGLGGPRRGPGGGGGRRGGGRRGRCRGAGRSGGAWRPAAGRGLAGVDLCHAVAGGTAALPGLLAKRFFGTPLLVTEYRPGLREHYLAPAGGDPTGAGGPAGPAGASEAVGPAGPGEWAAVAGDGAYGVAARALVAAFHRELAAEVYAQAALVTAGNADTRRWQERCGADPARLRTVYPGVYPHCFDEVGERAGTDARTLLWVGPVEPERDLVALLHAFAEVHRAEPDVRLRIVDTGPATAPPDPAWALAATPPDTAALHDGAPPLMPGPGAVARAAYGASGAYESAYGYGPVPARVFGSGAGGLAYGATAYGAWAGGPGAAGGCVVAGCGAGAGAEFGAGGAAAGAWVALDGGARRRG